MQYLHSPVKSHRGCMKHPIPNRQIEYTEKGFSGVQVCKSSLCYSCSRKVQQNNAALLAGVIEQTSHDHDFAMVTLTLNTDRPVAEQALLLQLAYARFIKSIRKAVQKKGFDIQFCWQNDATFDLGSYRTHLHRHLVARVTKGCPIDFNDRAFRWWEKAVAESGGGSVVRKAFYWQPVESGGAATRYLFKLAAEVLHSTSKKGFGNRVGWYGLGDEILGASGTHKERLVGMYRAMVAAMKGKRWFGISKKMREDYTPPEEPEEQEDSMAGEEKEKRTITIGKVSPHVHRAIVETGNLWVVSHVLATHTDGDLPVEALRYIVEKYNRFPDTYWQTETNYRRCMEEVSVWGRDTASGI